MIFVRYSPIQFVIMQAMTSFTLNSALNNPESAPQSAPINAATIMHAYQGSCHTSAAYNEKQIPMQYCPPTPILNKPALYANITESPHMISGTDFTNVEPK